MTAEIDIAAVEERHVSQHHAENMLRQTGRYSTSWRDCTTGFCIKARQRLLGESICQMCLQVRHGH